MEKAPGRLLLQDKWEEMARYAYVSLRYIPKSERFTMGAEIRNSIWSGFRLIIRARNVKTRLSVLLTLDEEVKVLLSLFRVSFSLGIIPPKKYQILSEKLVEIGKMLGGWIKSCR